MLPSPPLPSLTAPGFPSLQGSHPEAEHLLCTGGHCRTKAMAQVHNELMEMVEEKVV